MLIKCKKPRFAVCFDLSQRKEFRPKVNRNKLCGDMSYLGIYPKENNLNVSHRLHGVARRGIDAAISITGQSGLTRYLRYTGSLSKSISLSPRRRKFIAELPTARSTVISVAAKPAGFLYFTPGATDELHAPARSDFEAWEPVSRSIFYLFAKEASIILDVGAYSGVYSLTALASNPSAHVFAFEPNAPMSQQITESSRLNGFSRRLIVNQCALADYEGFAELQRAPSNSSAGIASIIYSHDQHPVNVNNPKYQSGTSGVESILVPVRRIDDFDFGGKVDLIKVDAEGSETSIFRGARKVLQESRPIILSEALTSKDLQEQFQELKLTGYLEPIAVNIDGHHGDDCNFIWCHPDDYQIVKEVVRISLQRSCWCHGG